MNIRNKIVHSDAERLLTDLYLIFVYGMFSLNMIFLSRIEKNVEEVIRKALYSNS